jgi:hypothetical protein
MSPIVTAIVVNIVPLLPVVLTGIAAAVPVLVGLWLKSVKDERDREAIRRTVKGAYVVIAAIAAKTATPLDDLVAEILRRAEEELGRPLKHAEATRAKNMTLALQASPAWPDAADTSPDLVGRALAAPPNLVGRVVASGPQARPRHQ